MFEAIRRDLAFAVRSLLRSRGVTALAVASLAIGIAANATVFSLVQAVEFPLLIYPEASRIVFLESRNDARGLVGMPVSAPDSMEIAGSSRTLELPSLVADQSSILQDPMNSRRVHGKRVAPSFFQVMRVPARAGRTLAAGDSSGVIVLSEDLWVTAFNRDPAVVGRAIRLDGGAVTVVGVMPRQFDAGADFWVPLESTAGFARDDRQFTLFARLGAGMSIAEASTELAEVSRRMAFDHPATNGDWTTFPTPLTRMHGRDSRGAFILLQGAVAFVLLIACANIANILLARGTRRRHEMAVRVALGAGRRQVVGLLLTESLVLAFAGGAAGVLLSMWGIRMARAVGGFPDAIDPDLNWIVLGFTASITMITGIASGIVPALRASAVAPESVLRSEDARGIAGGRARLRATLVVAQIACALVLAIGVTLMVRTLVNRQHVDLGFNPAEAIRADLVLPLDRYEEASAWAAVVTTLVRRVERSPDVVAAGASAWALPTGAGAQRQLTLPDEGDVALPMGIRRGIEAVTPRYFEALGVPLKAGRAFTDADGAGTAAVAIVNDELARHLWPERNPVGRSLRLGSRTEAARVVTIVGVVNTVRRSAMHDVPVARVYLPFAQHPNATTSIVVRGRGEMTAAVREVRAALRETDATLLLEGVRTVEADLAQFIAPIRMITWLLGAFGLVGLCLAALGVFGTMSYTVSQREHEMAVRCALGADRADIFRVVFGSAVRITAVGVGVGTAIAFAATRTLASLLFGVSPTDPAVFILVTAFLVLVLLAACYAPARVAARSDPMALLRR